MDRGKVFTVSLLGISDFNSRLLKSIFLLSASRDRSYILYESKKRGKAADIHLVGPEGNDLAAFSSSNCDSSGAPTVPAVFVGNPVPNGAWQYHIQPPFRATQVLKTLDVVTAKEFDFVPELTIREDHKSEGISEGVLEHLKSDRSGNSPIDRVLVVDDSAPVRKQLEIFINRLGASVDLADSGEAALAKLERGRYSGIFLDVVMPGVDGYKVCKEIKKNPDLRFTPVILLTSKSSPFDKVRGTLAGCDGYLTKPVDHLTFEKTLKSFLVPSSSEQNKTS